MTRFKIPYVNLAGQHAPLKAELLEAVAKVFDEAQFVLGDQVANFEQEFATLCGVRHAVSVNSGTDALILALKVAGVQPGDEVITVPNSFVATTSSIRLVGAKPVFVDVGEDYNMDPTKIARAVSRQTKVILPVHLTGQPCDMEPIMELAASRGLVVIEDAAQAVLARIKERTVGSIGQLGCFSLHPLKTLNACGDGGVITTSDSELSEKLKVLRNIGLRTRDDCVVWSSNSRLDTIQAAMLLVKLRYLQQWTETRRQNARFFRERLTGLDQLQIPLEYEGRWPVYHTFVIQADRRDDLKTHLAEKGIGTAIHYPVPIHLSTAGLELGYPRGSFPVAERLAARILSLPIYPNLTAPELNYIAETIREFYRQ